MNIYHLIRERSKKWADHPAIHDDYGSLSFNLLINDVEALSTQLQQIGLKEKMGLGIISSNSREFIAAILAGLNCGAVVMPLSHKLTDAEINEIINETKLHALLNLSATHYACFTPTHEVHIQNKNYGLSLLDSSGQKFAPHVREPAFIRFTSGTTGKSKGVIISHQSVLERIMAANKGLKLGPADTVIWVLPIAYHFVVSITLYLFFGSAVALCNDFLAKAIADYAIRFKGTLLYCAPMHIRLLAGDNNGISLDPLKRVISTSAGIPAELCRSFKTRFGMPVSQAFGIIEVGLPILNFEQSDLYPEAVGYALPDYEVEILDDDYHILPPGKIGNLAIKGPGMFDAYLTPPQVKDDILVDGRFMTGDLASKTKEGLIKIEGREKSMINVSGNKVFPEEVEAAINSHATVQASRVTGQSHPLLGEIVTAEVILKPGQLIEVEELLRYCRGHLASFKIPQRVKFVTAIPKTGTGKVKRV